MHGKVGKEGTEWDNVLYREAREPEKGSQASYITTSCQQTLLFGNATTTSEVANYLSTSLDIYPHSSFSFDLCRAPYSSSFGLLALVPQLRIGLKSSY